MSFLLKEDGGVLLKEDGGKLVLNRAPIILGLSANIAAGAATATTAQLTAPSGKTTADFAAASISDDTNPLPAVDPATDLYLEPEWCIQLTEEAVPTTVYKFRVTLNGIPLTTYTVTPKLTYSTGDTLMAGSAM